MKHTTKIIVRSYECDAYNHVNNAVYLNYLEHGRMEFLHAVNFDYKGVIASGFYLYVTHIDIHYKASAFLDDELFVEVEAKTLKAVSGDFIQKIYKADGTVCCEAVVSWAAVNHDGRPTRMPEPFLSQLKNAYQE